MTTIPLSSLSTTPELEIVRDYQHPITAPRQIARLEELERVLRANFYKPDTQAVRIVLGAIQAHRLNLGDPAWLFVVAPPGSGKTTITIMGTCGLPDVRMLGDFSENTFLSGFYGHQQPGTLEKLGHTVQNDQTYTTMGNAVLVAKDFTTVLSMRREKRAAILGQLREIHDGEFKRDFGTGVTKIWKGRVSVIAAVTPVLDKCYSIFSVLGERFMQLRWHRPESEEAGEWAIRQQGREGQFQDDIKHAVRGALDAATPLAPRLCKDMQERIASLAEIIAIGRTHVYRSSYGNREIEYAPEPEANTRLSKGLAAIAKGAASVRGHEAVGEDDLQDAFRVALDCLTDYRRRLFLAVAYGQDAESIGIPKTMRQRALEELDELGVVEKPDSKSGYRLSERIARLWGKAAVR
jgi:hypothetical protein